jgi:hypothetical protein
MLSLPEIQGTFAVNQDIPSGDPGELLWARAAADLGFRRSRTRDTSARPGDASAPENARLTHANTLLA